MPLTGLRKIIVHVIWCFEHKIKPDCPSQQSSCINKARGFSLTRYRVSGLSIRRDIV